MFAATRWQAPGLKQESDQRVGGPDGKHFTNNHVDILVRLMSGEMFSLNMFSFTWGLRMIQQQLNQTVNLITDAETFIRPTV